MKISKKVQEKCKKIDLVLTDVDGVLTDGGMFYAEGGKVFRKFNTRDGMGIELLKKNGIITIFLTKENSEASKKRAKKLKTKIYFGVQNKEKKLKDICKIRKINNESVAYIGDDIGNFTLLKKVGFNACPKNSSDYIKEVVGFVTEKNGGEGAFREFVEYIVGEERIKKILEDL